MSDFAKTVNPRCFAAGRCGRRALRSHTGERRTLRYRVLTYGGARIITYSVLPTPTPVAS